MEINSYKSFDVIYISNPRFMYNKNNSDSIVIIDV